MFCSAANPPSGREINSVADERENQETPNPGVNAEAAAGEPGKSDAAGPGEAAQKPPAVPKPPPAAKPPAAKPKGPQKEPWSDPLVDALRERFSGEILDAYTFLAQRQLLIKKDRLTEIMAFLRRNEIEPFDFLSDETATHWHAEEEFELVYMLFSFKTHGRVRVKTRIKEWESIESLVSVWPGADWLEREVYDMFGVRYANHPNLKRILLPEDWTGFPLRKDYNLRLQDVEWVRKHLGIESGQRFYVGEARHEEG